MATVTTEQLTESESTTQPASSNPGDPKPRRLRRAVGWIVVLLLLLSGLAWFAPAIVAHTVLRQQIVPMLLPEFQGTCHIGSASCGWLSPVVLNKVTLSDAEQNPLLTAQVVASKNRLLDLLKMPERLGEFVFQSPNLNLVLRPGGSNIEDALEPYLNNDEASATAFEYRLDVQDGTIQVLDAKSEQFRTLSQVSLQLQQSADPVEPLVVSFSTVLEETQPAGRLSATLEWRAATDRNSATTDGSDLTVKSEDWQLEPLQPLLDRFGLDIHVSGSLSADLHAVWNVNDERTRYTVTGSASVSQLTLDAPEYLGSDRLRLDSLAAAGHVGCSGDQLSFDDFRLESEAGQVVASGELNTSVLEDYENLEAYLSDNDCKLNAELNLQRLAELLPQLLHIRSDSKIKSGRATIAFSSSVVDAQRQWTGRAQVTDFAAAVPGRQDIRWKQPIEIHLAAHHSENGLVVDRLDCDSHFLQLSASGTHDRISLSSRCSLDRLGTELGQFVNLGESRFAGQLTASLNGSRDTQGKFQVEGQARATQFEWSMPGQPSWQEQELAIVGSVQGVYADGKLTGLDAGHVKVTSGRDSLDVRPLTTQVDILTETAEVPLKMQVTGELSTWLRRLRPWLQFDGWDLSGHFGAEFQGRCSRHFVVIESGHAEFQNLHMHGGGVTIDEPQLSLEIAGTWDNDRSQFNSTATVVRSRTVSGRAVDVALRLRESALPEFTGGLAVSVDLDRFGRYFHSSSGQPTLRVRGSAVGQFKFAQNGNVTDVAYRIKSDKLAAARRTVSGPSGQPLSTPQWETLFEEGPLSLSGGIQYDHQQDSWRINQLQLISSMLRLHTKGLVSDLSGVAHVDLSGEIAYDLESVASRFRDVLGDQIQARGSRTQAFTLKGPLFATTESGWPRQLACRTAFGWEQASVYGLSAGPGEIKLQMENGVLFVQPIDLDVSEGRVTLAPRFLLDRSPQAMALDKGPIAEKIRFSPEMCAAWLKFVAPLLADATQIEGRFSAAMTSGLIPLWQPRLGDVDGVLHVHGAQVQPGPLAQQLIMIVKHVESILKNRSAAAPRNRNATLLAMPDQEVSVRMRDGRVHHQSLTFAIQDALIRTSGSVGFDETLSVTAEVPILERWIGNDKLLAGLKGHIIRVPIRGTLGRPQIDNQAINDLLQQVLGSATNRLIQDELDKQLNKLFRRK